MCYTPKTRTVSASMLRYGGLCASSLQRTRVLAVNRCLNRPSATKCYQVHGAIIHASQLGMLPCCSCLAQLLHTTYSLLLLKLHHSDEDMQWVQHMHSAMRDAD